LERIAPDYLAIVCLKMHRRSSLRSRRAAVTFGRGNPTDYRLALFVLVVVIQHVVGLKHVEQVSRQLRKDTQAYAPANEVIVGNRQGYLRGGRLKIIRQGAVDGEPSGRNEELGAPMEEFVLQRVELAYTSTSLQHDCDNTAVEM